MTIQNPPIRAQTHYSEPFSTYFSLILFVASLLLVVGIVIAAMVPGGDQTMAIAVILLLILWTFDMAFVLVTSPSVGRPKREVLHLQEATIPVYTVRPFFGRQKCERTGGLHLSRFHGHVVDFNAPYVLYTCFGKELRVRWEPALWVVDW